MIPIGERVEDSFTFLPLSERLALEQTLHEILPHSPSGMVLKYVTVEEHW